jgi:protocatechuate 3,4-dioxygenase beta subunit
MRSRKTAALAALGVIVAGGVAAYLAMRGGGEDARAGRGGGRVATSPGLVAPASSTRALAPGAVAIEAARDDDPRGGLRLEGQVIDAASKPVAGARVAIDSVPPREVVTEADGAFAFDGLLPRDYVVEATAESGHAGPVWLRLVPDAEPVTLQLAPAGTVEVTVTAADGSGPVAGATVELRGTLTYQAQTGADGVAILRGVGLGWAPLVAHAPGFAPAGLVVGTTGDPGTPLRVSLALGRGAALAGRVVDDHGAAVAGARVHASSVTDPLPVTDPRRDGVTTGADGSFVLPAVAAGTWRLSATHDLGVVDSPPITVDGAHRRDGVVLVLAPAGIVRGTVRDARGRPVGAADVTVVVAGHVDWRTRRRAYAAADGTFAVRGLPRRAVEVVAWHPTGASAISRVDLAAVREAEVALVLDVAGAIAGTVVDGAGAAIGDAQVIAEPAASGDPSTRAEWSVRGVPLAITDQAGAFRFVGLPAGEYRLRATRPGAAAAAIEQAAAVAARPGDSGVRLVVAADGRITGKVAFADGAVPAAFTIAIDGAPPVGRAATDGAFGESVPPGTHAVTFAGPGFIAKTVADVVVEADRAADLGTVTVERGRSVSGRVLDAGGAPVEGAQVAAGSLLTGGGAELYIDSESINARDTTTDADGRFRIEGLAPTAITVVGGKPGLGRSTSVRLPGPASAVIDLVLTATAGLEGKVTRGGAPLADTVIIATPMGAAASNFFVISGPDGGFVLDALAPDTYVVLAMLGGGGSQPKDMFARRVEVVAGARARVELDATPGATELAVTVTRGGATAPMAMVLAFEGRATAATMEDLRDPSRALISGDDTVAMYMRMAPGGTATIAGMRAGVYTACAAALAGPPDDPAKVPVGCATVELAAGQAAAGLAVDVPVPSAP